MRISSFGVATCALLTSVVCVSGSRARTTDAAANQWTSDTALFGEVVRTIKASDRWLASGEIPLLVDPRPSETPAVTGDAEALARASAPRHAEVAPEVVAGRRAILRQLGVPETDNATRGACPGATLGRRHGDPPPFGCPLDTLSVAAIGIPQRLPKARSEEWSVRVTMTRLSPSGASTLIEDYVLARASDGWRLVRKANSVWVE